MRMSETIRGTGGLLERAAEEKALDLRKAFRRLLQTDWPVAVSMPGPASGIPIALPNTVGAVTRKHKLD